MPVNLKLMKNLKKQHGKNKGKNVYFGMEAKGKVTLPSSRKGKNSGKKKMPSFMKKD